MWTFKLDDDSELRLLERWHSEELFQLTDSCRDYLREWLPWVDGTKSSKDSEEFIEFTQKKFASNDGFQAGIWHKGNLAGVIGFHKVDWPNRTTSIGYWIGREFQGKGLMTKACKVLVNHAFKTLKLKRVEIRCAADNHKSQAVPERLKFKKEGVLRNSECLYGKHVDHVVYGCTDDDWITIGHPQASALLP